MRNWFSDGALRKVLRNTSHLATTKLAGGLIGLIALICAGRGMSAADFGVVVLLHAYALGAAAVTKFQSWQMIVRYGTPAMAAGERHALRDAIRFACGLDIASGLFGLIVAEAGLVFFGASFGIGPDRLDYAMAYCSLIPTMSSSTPAGILRTLDRFDLMSLQQTATPMLRAVGCAACWALGLGMPWFLLVWYIADVGGDLVLWLMATSVLRAHAMLDALRPSLAAARRLPQVWRFVWSTNLATTLEASHEPASNMIIAGMLGPAMVGLYKIASSILASAIKPALLMEKGFYPEIMRLDPATSRPWLLGVRSGALAGGLGAAMVVGIWLLAGPVTALFGEKYRLSAHLLQTMAPAIVVTMAGMPLASLLLMAGRPTWLFRAHVVGMVIWLPTLVVLVRHFALEGAAIAFIMRPVLLALCSLAATLLAYSRRHNSAAATTIEATT